MLTVFYILWQCTWGFLQTAAGLAVFLTHFRKKHTFYRGAIVTEWSRESGVSLGLFVFVPAKCSGAFLRHEYGHTLQSLLLGPLYLLVIGLPSALWCSLPRFQKLRSEKRIPYSWLYTEKWADRWGEETAPRKPEK